MIIIKSRKEIIKNLILAVLAIAIGFGAKFLPFQRVFQNKTNDKNCIIVDAGHGLPDGGAVGVAGTVEQKINLAVAKKLAEVLEGKGIEAIMTRKTDECLCKDQDGKTIRKIKVEDMKNRLEIIKKSNADLFVSIHMNCFESEKAHGLRVFYDKSHPEIKKLAENIQNKIAEVTGAATYAVKSADESLFLMKNTSVPAILAECGFISNREEEKKLNDDDYQSRIAWAIADACEKYILSVK